MKTSVTSTANNPKKSTIKVRFENLRIKLKPIRLSTEIQKDLKKCYFFVTPSGEKKEVSIGLKEFLTHLDGSLELREILRLLFHKGETVFITEAIEWIQYLLKLNLIENPDDVSSVLLKLKNKSTPIFQRNRGEVPTKDEHKSSYFTKERLLAILRRTTLFYQTDHRLLTLMIENSEIKHFASNEFVIKKDDEAADIFVLLTGSVGVFPDFKHDPHNMVAIFTYQNIFGESAALLKRKRNADVLALESSFILKIPVFKMIKEKTKLQGEELESLKARVLLNQVLASNPLFGRVPTDILQFLLLKCSIENHPLGDIIIHEGQKDGCIYFILKGEVEILKGSRSLATLKTGEYFGEISALTSTPRTASVLSMTQTMLLRLHQSDLFDFMIKDIHTGLAIETEMMARYSEVKKVTEKISPPNVQSTQINDIHLNGDDIDELSRVNWDNLSLNFSAYGNADLDSNTSQS